MTNLESIILSFLVNALWQVPLLFAAGWLAAGAIRKLGAAAEHRVWVAVLLLQTLLPACSMIPWETLRTLSPWARSPLRDADAHVSVVMGPGTAFDGLHLPSWLLAAVAIAYALVTVWFAARFAWRWRKIQSLRKESTEAALDDTAAQYWEQCAHAFGIHQASLAASSRIFGPVTIGITRKLVLLPAAMVSTLREAEIRAAIAHEFAHMRRNDFLKNLAYELLSMPVAFHPLFWLTRGRIMESREMVCDQMAAQIADRSGEPHQYARSLLRLASLLVEGMPTRTPQAIGIFDSTTFERRVMRLTEKQPEVSPVRRFAAVATCALLGFGITGSALALSLHVDPLAVPDEAKSASPKEPINVSSDKMAAQLLSKVSPLYPVDAKKARIQGTVKLQAVIGKTGEVEQLKVADGPDELQKSALDAVRKWTYKPFLLNGEPVEVKTTISVVYTLKK
jgi:TonB family protein